jgi:hypothetical protein
MDSSGGIIDRVQRNQSGTLNAYWERDGIAWDPGANVTVTIINDAGTALVTAAATQGSGTNGRSYVLPATATATLDYLTAQWTSPSDGSVLTTYAEVVGGYLFSVAQARTRTPLMDTTSYPTEQIENYRMLAEMALEDICGVAFVPRFSRDIAHITGWGLITVPRRQVTKVRQIYTQSEQGPQALTTLAGLRIEQGGLIFMPSLWTWWSTPITVTYEHGFQWAPPRVARAALELARRWLIESPWDERTTGFRTRDGGEMTILTASHTAAFDIPEVVAVADQYSMPAIN